MAFFCLLLKSHFIYREIQCQISSYRYSNILNVSLSYSCWKAIIIYARCILFYFTVMHVDEISFTCLEKNSLEFMHISFIIFVHQINWNYYFRSDRDYHLILFFVLRFDFFINDMDVNLATKFFASVFSQIFDRYLM